MRASEPNPTRPRARRARRARRAAGAAAAAGGFTLIEILIAVGIIAVLVAIGAVGYSKITGQSKERQTVVTLENARSMLAEYESKGGLGGLNPPYAMTDSVAAPLSVTHEGYLQGNATQDHRYNSAAVLATRDVMGKLLTLPPNKTAMSRLSANQILPDEPTTAVNEAQWNVLLDGWGNPIIFVPGGGMTGVSAGGVVQPIVRSRDDRPYFASAGPDGDFSKGDDNLYSSEEVKYTTTP